MSVEHGGFIAGAEGLTQHPAAHLALVTLSLLNMNLTVARDCWEQGIMGRNPAIGRPAWVTKDGLPPTSMHDEFYNVQPMMGSVPAKQ